MTGDAWSNASVKISLDAALGIVEKHANAKAARAGYENFLGRRGC
ncbi:hypothetical protein [Bradyrhizobium betae]|nr:hypothetical protein [Bradyrhizobium betae]